MKKKSPLALFSSLAISGLLLVWSTNAFQYTTNGISKIAFDKDHFNYVDTILYWESYLDKSTCYDNGTYGKVCEINWWENEYTVTVNFRNIPGATIDFIYLNITNNIKKINNYDWIYISSLYLNDNTDIDLNNTAPTNIWNIYKFM